MTEHPVDAYRVRAKGNGHGEAFICRDCALRGLDEDMESELLEVREGDGPLYCEVCERQIVGEEAR